jgi:hypothetical protein
MATFPKFSIWDTATLTSLVNDEVDTNLERQAFLGDQIAPLRDTQSRAVRVEVGRTYSFGIGQFKAPDAVPPLIEMPVGEREERMIELALLEEMHRITGDQWQALNSRDENVRRAAGLDVIERGRILQTRNERLTEWMRWQAFRGSLTITYPTGSTLVIDYGFPSGHTPTPATLWTDTTNSDPVADLEAWQQKLADDSGALGTRIHLTSNTAKLILQNQKLKTYYNVPSGQPFKPTLQDVANLLAAGTEFIIYDAGFRPMQDAAPRTDASHTRYLPNPNVLVTTPYNVDGEAIADTPNGLVEISSGYNQTSILQGPQSEVILDHMTKNRYLRQASARIPRINHPECFLWATVTA